MKKIILIALACVMLLSVVSCGNSAMKEAAGTYAGVKTKFVGDSEWVTDDDPFSLELKADGTAVSKKGDYEYEATWTLDGENFTLKEKFLGLTNEYTGTLKDGEIDIFNGDPANELTCEFIYKK